MDAPIVSLRGLEKRYGEVRALRELDLELPPGPAGLLGPNGAGKTTLIKLLLGLLEPTSGTARIVGLDPARRKDRLAIRRMVGYMPEGDCLLPGMSAVELVSTLGRITGLARQDAMTRAHEVLDYVELEEARYRGLEEYSTGMKQRLKLAQALVHDPQLLLLDEPTNGLDPKGRKHMLDLVEDLGHAQGKSILLCSHLLPDVERTCEHIVVIDHGRAVEQGTIRDLTGGDGLLLHIDVEGGGERLAAALTASGVRLHSSSTTRISVHVEPEADDADDILAAAADLGIVVTGIDPARSTLEDVFLAAVDGAADLSAPSEPGSVLS